VTDPPYYDNVPYADLSDFFYVWLRRSLRTIYPSLFSTLLTPKTEELVADSVRFGGRELARAHFESRMSTALTRLHAVQAPEVPMAIFYAFRQAETTTDGGTASTGWETMLEAVLAAGLTIEGTWPIRTEQTGGLRELGRNALASSIVLVCRRRKEDAPLATRRDFTLALRRELPDALRALQAGNVAPVDLAQAAIGPGMAIFSRFDRIVETDGSRMTVRPALDLINAALDHVLAEQEGDFDADTRFALTWFEQFGLGEARYGEAETLSKAKNTSVAGLVEAGILSSRSGRVRLLARDELAEDWDPLADDRLTVWEVTQYITRALEYAGEESAADLLRKIGGLAEPARELAYRLYSACERKGWAQEGLAYNGLIVAWPELGTLAGTAISTTDAVQESLEL
jgi:putative DNA methylase